MRPLTEFIAVLELAWPADAKYGEYQTFSALVMYRPMTMVRPVVATLVPHVCSQEVLLASDVSLLFLLTLIQSNVPGAGIVLTGLSRSQSPVCSTGNEAGSKFGARMMDSPARFSTGVEVQVR